MASMMGVPVHWEDHLPIGWMGAYSSIGHSIFLLAGLSKRQERSVLAHELGHAHYRHDGSTRGNEWHADKWAAQQVIKLEDYAEASRGEPSLDQLARRLGVTSHLTSVYIKTIRAPDMFLTVQPVKLELRVPTFQETCMLAA